MREILWAGGECDLLCILEADDEAALTAFSLATAAQGRVRLRSMRAYTVKEMEAALARLP